MSYNLEKIVSRRTKIYHQLEQYYTFCEQVRRMSHATLLSKTYAINNFVASARATDLRKITNQTVLNWISEQSGRGNSGRSINNRLAHLKAMLRWQKEMNLEMPKLQLSMIPKAQETPPRKVTFTREQISRVLRQANLQEWLLIKLAFDCGLRISELTNLRLSDIQDNRLSIIGKGGKRRYAYISTEVQEKLALWISTNEISSFLWPSPLCFNKPQATCTIRQYMQATFLRAGIRNFCPHDLRHSYATDLKKLGVPTRQIQAGLGHSTENITERYLSDLEGFNLQDMYRIKYRDDPC